MIYLVGQLTIQMADDEEGLTQMQLFFCFSYSTTLSLYRRGDSLRDEDYAIVGVFFCFLLLSFSTILWSIVRGDAEGG